METLSAIINEIKPAADWVNQFDNLACRISQVLPFQRCLIGFERLSRDRAQGFTYRSAAAPGPCGGRSGQTRCTGAWGLRRYLSCLRSYDQLDHAFCWHDAGHQAGDADVHVHELASYMNGGQGVAAFVDTAIAGEDDVATLLQFDCEPVSMRQTLLVSFIAFHLHSMLTLHSNLPSAGDVAAPGVCLTAKERDVLRWVVEGKTSWEIGRILSSSERTVKFHLKNVYAKLNVTNRAQAVAVVNRLRLI